VPPATFEDCGGNYDLSEVYFFGSL